MSKNKNFFMALLLLSFAISVVSLVPEAGAQTKAKGLQYTLLEKIPGTDNVGSDLPGYLKAIYKVALVIIVLSAVLMLSIGGFMYLTSAGNTAAMGTAKGVIFDSLIGLTIAFTAWLLLNVINPDLVNVTINALSPVSVPGAPAKTAPGAAPPTGAAWPSDKTERDALGGNFNYNKDNCKTSGQAEGCTSMAGSAAIGGLQSLQKSCNCSMTITGGTECWQHGTCGADNHHTQGDYAVDIAHGAVDNYITKNQPICSLKGRPVYQVGNAIYWDEDSAHWHANFNKSGCQSI
ncbi:MAG: pilin [Patescibacteria group bacterium]